MIYDDNGLLWSSSDPAAYATGLAILNAVENGRASSNIVKDNIGDQWTGDLVLVQELARTR